MFKHKMFINSYCSYWCSGKCQNELTIYLSKCNQLVMQLIPVLDSKAISKMFCKMKSYYSFTLFTGNTNLMNTGVSKEHCITVFVDLACTVLARDTSVLIPIPDTYNRNLISVSQWKENSGLKD